MQEIIEVMSYPWALRALLVSMMVGIMCGVLGCFIVLRNMSLLGDALSHAILPGVFFAFLLFGYSAIGFFAGATVAGVLTAVGISWLQQHVQTKNDASIGIIFTAMFSIGVIGISKISKSDGVHLDLQHFLFGNIFGVTNEDLIITSIVLVYTLISVVVLYRYLFISTFQSTIAEAMGVSVKTLHYFLMFLLSIVVVASLSAAGVILVVAMLVTPAATALLLSNKLKNVLVISALIGLLTTIVGFFVTVVMDTTPGPAMCLVATMFYLTAVFFSPTQGLIHKAYVKYKEKNRIIHEDVLRLLEKSKPSKLAIDTIADKLDHSNIRIKQVVQRMLNSKHVIKVSGNFVILTALGDKEAVKMQRAHRLWETYQTREMGIDPESVHQEAELFEHHLNDDLLSRVDNKLGFPDTDPHGSPIPRDK